MNQENQVSLKEFNLVAGNLHSVLYAQDTKGYYLPEISCQAMTSEYLSVVLRGKVFRIEKKEFKKFTPLQNTKKADFFIKIKELIFHQITKGLWFHTCQLTQQIVANLSAILSKSQWLIVFKTQDRRYCRGLRKKWIKRD